MSTDDGRRPLKVRSAKFSLYIAKYLSQKNITPNQISIASVFFALLAAICLLSLPYMQGNSFSLFAILAAVFIQGRLLCNLFDGMVAIEGGKSTASGELFNDIPDRIADPIILIAAGYSITLFTWGSTLGWSAALLAVLTAYVRTLSLSIGAPADFSGPMAKQHRMAIITFACVTSALETFLWSESYSLLLALIVINFGCIATLINRIRNAYRALEQK